MVVAVVDYVHIYQMDTKNSCFHIIRVNVYLEGCFFFFKKAKLHDIHPREVKRDISPGHM